MKSEYTGENGDEYTNKGRMWEIARRYNNQSVRLNGYFTIVKRKNVKKYKRLGVL